MATVTMQDIDGIKAQVIQASLELAVGTSWADLTLWQIADHAGVNYDDVNALFPETIDIIEAYIRQIDNQVIADMENDLDPSDPPRDRLFDVLMERFDLLNNDRAAVKSIMNAVTMDPKGMIILAPMIAKSMTRMMDLTGVETSGIKGSLRVAGVSMAYLKSVRDWAKDETADMAPTMASLDQALGYVEKIV